MAIGTERDAMVRRSRSRYGSTVQLAWTQPDPRPRESEPTPLLQRAGDDLPEERPLTVEINGRPVATLLCTPDAPAELGVGWAYGHGYFDAPAQLLRVRGGAGRVALMIDRPAWGGAEWSAALLSGSDVTLHQPPRERQLTLVSREHTPPREEPWRIDSGALQSMVTLAFGGTSEASAGELPRAALADEHHVRALARDISRHNSVDKVIGWALLEHVARDGLCLLLSGRISVDIVHKAWRAGLSLIASPGVPTRQAVALAAQRKITLVGRAHESRRVAYTHPWRLLETPRAAALSTDQS